MEHLVYTQANLRVLKDIAMGAPIVEINLNTIDIKRVPTLKPYNLEGEDLYVFFREKIMN